MVFAYQTCYYVCYSVILAFCFLIFPANFFYHGVAGEGDEEPAFSRKLCKSLQEYYIHILKNKLLII